MAEKQKPPLGLRPQILAERDRITEICSAMIRYCECCQSIPADWLEELNDRAESYDILAAHFQPSGK